MNDIDKDKENTEIGTAGILTVMEECRKPDICAVQRVINWNKDRYDKEFDQGLSESLMFEEAFEGVLADTDIERIDSAGDILFVAVGVLWKADYLNTEEDIIVLNWIIREGSLPLLRSLFQKRVFINYNPTIELVMTLMELAFMTISKLLHIEGYNAEDVLDVICWSNETKVIPDHKVDSRVKANIDKGDSYISPTAHINDMLTPF